MGEDDSDTNGENNMDIAMHPETNVEDNTLDKISDQSNGIQTSSVSTKRNRIDTVCEGGDFDDILSQSKPTNIYF